LLRDFGLNTASARVRPSPAIVSGQADTAQRAPEPTCLVIRSVNGATSYGVNTRLNALNPELGNYRPGPTSGRTAVPSLLDADGCFFSPCRVRRFRAAVAARSVRLVRCWQVIEVQGLKSMRRPEEDNNACPLLRGSP
jgi:hypothetical protein